MDSNESAPPPPGGYRGRSPVSRTEGRPGPTRRQTVRAGALAVSALLAGCSGLSVPDSVKSYEFRAEPVVLPADARRELEYRRVVAEPIVTESRATIEGVEISATIESHVEGYERTSDDADVAVVGTLSTPQATVRDHSFNPAASVSLSSLLTHEIGRQFVGTARRSWTAVPEWEESPTVVDVGSTTLLGEETRLVSFAGVLSDGSERSGVVCHLSQTESGDRVFSAGVGDRRPDEVAAVDEQRLRRETDAVARANERLVRGGDADA